MVTEGPTSNDTQCCQGMTLALSMGIVTIHIRLGQLMVSSIDEVDSFIVNYCPWCGIQVNDDINLPSGKVS